MPDRVIIGLPFAKEINSHGVGNSARKKKSKGARRKTAEEGLYSQNRRPSHCNVAYKGEDLEALKIYSVQHDAENGKKPFRTEEQPTDRTVQSDEGIGRVGACYQDEDRIMIHYSEEAFKLLPFHSVVDA